MRKNLLFVLTLIMVPFAAFSQNDTILVDLGEVPSASPWNNVGSPTTGSVDGLLNQYGATTPYNLAITDVFNNINLDGTQSPDPALGMPASATGDSFFGNVATFGGQEQPTAAVTFSNLNTDYLYTFEIFCSRTASDNRETQFDLQGATTDVGYVNAASNTSELAVVSAMPAGDGTITITASPGPNNTNGSGFYYMGAIRMIYPQDETIEPEAFVVEPNGGEYWQVGRDDVELRWKNTTQTDATIEYSTDNGSSWSTIGTYGPLETITLWTVPDDVSMECLVRITADGIQDESDAVFEITDDEATCPIVVLGSSTAAGTGASQPDSAWVNKYRAEIYQNDTRYPIINLGVGGYTTYHILPTGTPIPDGVNVTINPERNVTKALTYDPAAIIINMPSNDAANNFPLEDQMANFQLIVETAAAGGAISYVCTTQPRNFTNPGQITLQEAVRDAIFDMYGEFAIDFWNGVATDEGTIMPSLDSGDGIHLNDMGHDILYSRVIDKQLDTLCNAISTDIPSLEFNNAVVSMYPNPFSSSINLAFTAKTPGIIEVAFHDILGRNLYTYKRGFTSGAQVLEIMPNLPKDMPVQVLVAKITITEANQTFQTALRVVKN